MLYCYIVLHAKCYFTKLSVQSNVKILRYFIFIQKNTCNKAAILLTTPYILRIPDSSGVSVCTGSTTWRPYRIYFTIQTSSPSPTTNHTQNVLSNPQTHTTPHLLHLPAPPFLPIPNPPRNPAQAPPPTLHLRTTHNALGRQYLYGAYHVAEARLQKHERYAESSTVAAESRCVEECGAG